MNILRFTQMIERNLSRIIILLLQHDLHYAQIRRRYLFFLNGFSFWRENGKVYLVWSGIMKCRSVLVFLSPNFGNLIQL